MAALLAVLHTYVFWIITDTMINDASRKTHEERKTQEDFFNNIVTSHFICKGSNG